MPTPCVTVPSYQTDERALVWILEADARGALGEDVLTGMLVELSARELHDHWRRVIPSL